MRKKIGKLGTKKGLLLCSGDGRFFFREMHEGGRFTDYDIYHSDLAITIDDEDAYVYEADDGELVIDHTPETLGD